MIKDDPMFEAASKEFDRLVAVSKKRVLLRDVARAHGISPTVLANYRANYPAKGGTEIKPIRKEDNSI